MRLKLKDIEDVRATFIGEFERYGEKRGWKGVEKTLLFKNITDENGDIVADHLWFSHTKEFEKVGKLNPGELVRFDARSKLYIKGYQGRRVDVYDAPPITMDYKLSYPTNVKRIEESFSLEK